MDANQNQNLTGRVVLPGVTVIGKINLAKFNKTAPKKAVRSFKPFSGGYTIGEMLRAKKIKLA
jgi:hypothetical protein